jgi:hypothetical protein
MTCPYCQRQPELVTGEAVYPHLPELWDGNFYLCRPCGAYVGCHKGTTNALGRLADAELRRAKMAAHKAFDGYWKPLGVQRGAAYRWLAEQLGIDRKECHIGLFNVEQCGRVIELVRRQRAGTVPELSGTR